jgi:hypothetical protein
LRTAAETGRPHFMPVQRYDLRRPDGKFAERRTRWQRTTLKLSLVPPAQGCTGSIQMPAT